MRLLLIDDDDDVRRIARLSLTRIGAIEVVDAASGQEGVRKAWEERPDAILLDVMMPGEDGPATLAALRADPATAAIPVIFLTAKAMTSEVERLKRLGAAGVVTKPFNPVTLALEIRAILEAG
ncbi:MAG TPA: response regulator [Thermoanaerobaculia bacterium]|nr:response regulator [Thermoanaerobaculia bacterium]